MRADIVADWIVGTEWAGWAREPITGDASARGYERLRRFDGRTVILMDAPPDICGSQSSFVRIGTHLRDHGLAAPDIYAWDDHLGLMVLEDLGQTDFAIYLKQHPNDERRLYLEAADILSIIASAPVPSDLTMMTPDVAIEMIDLAFEWAATDQSEDLSASIKSSLKELLETISPDPSTLSLRDFHAENLIWRPERTGYQRVGLLDFQDAFLTQPMYDLASLLRDARRDVDPDLTNTLLDRMKADDDMRSAFHVIAVQRNMRILGVFERLARRDGKTKYRALLPRVKDHLKTDLAAPILKDVAPLIRRAFDLGDGNHG